MAPAQEELLSIVSSDQTLKHAIFLRVQPTSAPSSIAVVAPVVSHRFEPGCLELKSGFDQTTGRSAGEIRLSASDPT
jgi:hypothetical protein